MGIAKVDYFGSTLVDLTGDTITPAVVLAGETFHAADGTLSTGSCTYDSDTSDATLDSGGKMLAGVTAYANGIKYTGTIGNGSATMPSGVLVDDAATLTVDGSGTLSLEGSATATPDVTAGYIASGTAGSVDMYMETQVTVRNATTITPTTVDQIIPSNTWLRGPQTVKGDANLLAAYIASGVSIFGVAGSLVAGDANFVRGTFTTTSTENTVQEVAIPYTGSGYPVAVVLFPSEGAYNSAGTLYNVARQYSIMFAAMVKARFDSTPNYANTGTRNYACTLYMYKNTSATSYSQSSGQNQVIYNGVTAPTSTNRLALKWKNATTLWLYVSAAGSYGFWPSIEYTYYVIYSS